MEPRTDVVNLFDNVHEMRDGAGVGVPNPGRAEASSLASRKPLTPGCRRSI